MAEQSPGLFGEAPSWQLELVRGIWELTVQLPEEFRGVASGNLRSCIDVSDQEVRVAIGEFKRSRWRLRVPESAQPIGAIPSCKLRTRSCRLVISWPHVVATPAAELKTGTAASGLMPSVGSNSDTPAELAGPIEHAPGNSVSIGAFSFKPSAVTRWPEPPAVSELSQTSPTLLKDDSTPRDPENGAGGKFVAKPDGVSNHQKDSTFVAAGSSPNVATASSGDSATDGGSQLPKCYQCGAEAKLCCTRCRLSWYCCGQCQRTHWSADHRQRCSFASRLASAEQQRRRGDVELAVTSLEDLLKDSVKAIRAEADKQLTYDSAVAAALLRNFAAISVALAASLDSEHVSDANFSRAAFGAIAAFLDAAAVLGEVKRPPEMQVHVEDIVSGISDTVSKDADPVLSAWMVYEEYARGLDSQPLSFGRKAPKLRAAALVAFRDVLAAAHDLLEASGGFADARAAERVDRLLDGKTPRGGGPRDSSRLRIDGELLQHLKPYLPGGNAS